MELSWETLDNYRKNLLSLREVTDKLLGRMKGHECSFRQDITDRKGKFRPEKLRDLVEELLSGWEETLRSGTDTDAATGESLAEPYLRARRELYGLYLYLTMRCSLCEGAYASACGGDEKERADFAFLLEQAGRLSRRWCVMAGPEGAKTNELYEGFDAHFGLHLYRVLLDPEGKSLDSALTPYWNAPMGRIDCLTDEGNMKRIHIRHLSSAPAAQPAEEPAPESADSVDGADYDDYGDFGDDGDYDPMESEWELAETYDGAGDLPGGAEWTPEKDDRASWLASLVWSFDGREEYLAACKRFAALFEGARPEVLRNFYEELEEIVDLYLLRRGLAPAADTDKALDVYSRVYDGPCQQAKRYARGLQWKNL